MMMLRRVGQQKVKERYGGELAYMVGLLGLATRLIRVRIGRVWCGSGRIGLVPKTGNKVRGG